jgi:hypothetical protein
MPITVRYKTSSYYGTKYNCYVYRFPNQCIVFWNNTVRQRFRPAGTGFNLLLNTVPVQSIATATGLTAGNYNVTVTDANGVQKCNRCS